MVVWTPLLAGLTVEPGSPGSAGEGADTQIQSQPEAPPAYRVGVLSSDLGRAGFVDAVASTVEQIHAGVVFQANVAHRLSAPFWGSTRALFADLARGATPAFGAYVELPARPGTTGSADATAGANAPRSALLSISPELFLSFDARTRLVRTRPMKGTRRVEPARGAAHARELLRSSEKDAAELAMIIDLMRNDLGRVCDAGSVRVVEARGFELHAGGTLVQSVGVVQGRLRDGLTLADLLEATFPPGSITGAPKVRAMQLIDEAEHARRGPWCGAIGHVAPDGSAVFNVAIRTASVSAPSAPTTTPTATQTPQTQAPRVLDYHVGAGVVAQSDPGDEWRETLDKASVLLKVLGRTRDNVR